MAFRIVLCVFAVLGQSFAGSLYRPKSSCGCGPNRVSITVNEDAPVYSSEGIAEIDYQSYKPVASVSASPMYSSDGGSFIITSAGPIVPSGIAVATELGLAGELLLSGEIPYLSAVAFEGKFDASGSAPVEYGCGDCVAITEQIGGNAPGSYSLSLGSGK